MDVWSSLGRSRKSEKRQAKEVEALERHTKWSSAGERNSLSQQTSHQSMNQRFVVRLST